MQKIKKESGESPERFRPL